MDKPKLIADALKAAGVQPEDPIAQIISAAFDQAEQPIDAWNELESVLNCIQRAQKTVA
jgi:hypothetical protein